MGMIRGKDEIKCILLPPEFFAQYDARAEYPASRICLRVNEVQTTGGEPKLIKSLCGYRGIAMISNGLAPRPVHREII